MSQDVACGSCGVYEMLLIRLCMSCRSLELWRWVTQTLATMHKHWPASTSFGRDTAHLQSMNPVPSLPVIDCYYLCSTMHVHIGMQGPRHAGRFQFVHLCNLGLVNLLAEEHQFTMASHHLPNAVPYLAMRAYLALGHCKDAESELLATVTVANKELCRMALGDAVASSGMSRAAIQQAALIILERFASSAAELAVAICAAFLQGRKTEVRISLLACIANKYDKVRFSHSISLCRTLARKMTRLFYTSQRTRLVPCRSRRCSCDSTC